jgi:vacuolar-type H+-ATPase subunit E/Vma4
VGGDAGVTLDTVRAAALVQASEQAEAIRRTAREQVDRVIAEAHEAAEAIREERRGAAERLARLEEHEQLARARADARATVLAARRSTLLAAAEAARAAARALVSDERYQARQVRLEADARKRLSATGEITITPVSDGGFVARAGSRQIDQSLDMQVDRCLSSMAAQLERLWA